MPKVKFTKTKIDELKFTSGKGEQIIYWDTNTPGLGLVVGARCKTFRLQIDIKDSTAKGGYRTVKKTLGRYGEITLEDAKAMLTGYIDKDGQAFMSERVKLRLEKTSGSIGEGITLNELVTEFYTQTRRKDGKERKQSSAVKYQADIRRHYASWLSLTLKEVSALSPDVVIERYQQIAQAGPYAARLTTTVLSGVLNYGVAKYPKFLLHNPLTVIQSRHVNIREKIKPRHECLVYDPAKKRNDFKVFFDAMSKMPDAQRDLHLFALYTGLRNMEASSLQWDNVDLTHGELKLKDTKNRQDLHIPLNKQAIAILKGRREQTEADVPSVFAATGPRNKTGYIALHATYLKKVTGLDITVHGLRRTFSTIGRKLKRFEDTSRLTNHVDSSVEGRHYDETGVEDLRETSQLIADTLERYMKESTGVVIQFPIMVQAA